MIKVLSCATVALVLSTFATGCAEGTDGRTDDGLGVYTPVSDEAQETNSGSTDEPEAEGPRATSERLAPAPSPFPVAQVPGAAPALADALPAGAR